MKERVICISDQWISDGYDLSEYPKKGEFYTIDGVDPNPGRSTQLPYYYLKELKWRCRNGGRVSFSHLAFRAVDLTFGSWVEHTLMPLVEVEEIEKQFR